MRTEIYYFSGTGNSLAVAKKMAEKMNANLIHVSKVIELESITTSAQIIGIVFPLYDFKPPKIIEEFIGKLNNISSKYIFAVCTYGIAPLKGMKYFNELIRRNGGKLSGGFAVELPHNGIGSSKFSEKKQVDMFRNCNIKLEIITEYVLSRKEGVIETSNAFMSFIMSGLFLRMIPTFCKLFRQVLFKGWDSLALNANEKCIGCESCMRICPVNNIIMINNKPSWGKHCAGCMACLHWCPNDAIVLGKGNINIRKYHHPEVKMIDMMNNTAGEKYTKNCGT